MTRFLLLGLLLTNGVGAQTVAELQAHLDADNLEPVQAWFDDHKKDKLSPDHRYLRGQLLLKSGDPKAAVEDLEAAAKALKTNKNAWLTLAEAAGDAAGKAGVMSAGGLAKTAKRALEKAVELDPDDIDARAGLIQFHTQAPWIIGGRTKEAYRQAEAIGRIDPKQGRRWKAQIDLSEGNTEAAEETFRLMLEEDPNQPDIAVALAVTFHDQERWKDAYEVLQPLAEADEPALMALYQLGRTGALSGQFLEPAAAAMQRYLSLTETVDSPPVPPAPALWRLGQVFAHQGDIDQARSSFERSLALDPENDVVKKALKSLPSG